MRGVSSCPFAFFKIGTDIKHREVIIINCTRILIFRDWSEFMRFAEQVVFQNSLEVL